MFKFFFFQAEDGIRDHAQSRGLGDVYKRQEDKLLVNQTLQNTFINATMLQNEAAMKRINGVKNESPRKSAAKKVRFNKEEQLRISIRQERCCILDLYDCVQVNPILL
eukprot:TRINITY_DN8497_c0_g1_i2.p2 TRINITY_DN8497_c0_g1~~TRINITY_DN8497_c0_g1_i2.p2  ORF type:complete len:108 (+),score=20.07 TRINITY_DN8497_c0_g1_i2:67-390(+)